MDKKKVYIGGGMLFKGERMQRQMEQEQIEALGHELYNPMANKAINDKANAVQEGLAERIVKHDTDAINWADTVIIEPLAHNAGSVCELGQCKGMKDVAEEILGLIDLNSDNSSDQILLEVIKACRKHKERKVYPHYFDVRRENKSEQSEDRREFGFHQYLLGVILDLTNGEGVLEFEDIVERLK